VLKNDEAERKKHDGKVFGSPNRVRGDLVTQEDLHRRKALDDLDGDPAREVGIWQRPLEEKLSQVFQEALLEIPSVSRY
jgi:hypothetical protein